MANEQIKSHTHKLVRLADNVPMVNFISNQKMRIDNAPSTVYKQCVAL